MLDELYRRTAEINSSIKCTKLFNEIVRKGRNGCKESCVKTETLEDAEKQEYFTAAAKKYTLVEIEKLLPL